jgi:RNA polymerase sigma factor (sigma-70 family)
MSKQLSIAADITNLIRRCAENDRQAQLTVYDLYARKMYNTSLRIVRSSSEAEDIIQESFLSAFRSLGSFRGDDVPFEAWLRRIVINKSLDYLRRNKHIRVDLDDNELPSEQELYSPDNTETALYRKEMLEQIKVASLNLPEGFRIIFSLYYYDGYDHEEIAEILGITASTSRSQLTRARKKIMDIINQKKSSHGR